MGVRFRAVIVNSAHLAVLERELTVIRCLRIYTGDFFIGGQFDGPLRTGEMAPFLI